MTGARGADLVRAEDGSYNAGCTDKHGRMSWSCIEFDGTGLWCDSCLAVSASVSRPESAGETR